MDEMDYPFEPPKLPWMIDFHSTHDGKILNAQFDAAFAADGLDHQTKLNIDCEVPRTRLTGIMCTIGPSSHDLEVLEKMIEAGLSVVRLKLSHYSLDECKELMKMIADVCHNYSKKMRCVFSLGIAVDIKGAEIRTGALKDPSVHEIELVQGRETSITNDPAYEEYVTEDMIYVDYQKINEVVEPGDHLLIDNVDNGQVRLSAIEIVGSIIRCLIETSGRIASHASVCLEGIATDLPELTETDIEAIKFCATEKVAFVLISCVQTGEVIKEVRKILGKEGRSVMVVSKIENAQGIYHIDEILKITDGVIISRRSLMKELPMEKIFLAQKLITGKCNKVGIPVVCASNILESMNTSLTPTNAEIIDVGNAITDGVDCFMLSRETAIGMHPVETIGTLAAICKEAEAALFQRDIFYNLTKTITPIEPLYAIAIAATEASMKCNAAAIIVTTVTGRSAKVLSRFRPRCPIIAVTRHAHISRLLNMWRGVHPIQYIKKPLQDWLQDIEKRIQYGLTHGKLAGYIRTGDALVIITGSKTGAGFTNSMKIVYASEFDC